MIKTSFIRTMLLFGFLTLNFSCNSDAITDEPMEQITEDNVNTDEGEMSDPSTPNSNANVISYTENNGIISVEFESAEGDLEWERGNTLDDFEGNGYLRWIKEDNFNTPGLGTLVYKLNIATPGTYQFVWRSRISEGDIQSEGNDSWLRFPDAADFFGQRENSIVYPKGVEKTPVVEGSSSNGWLKIYMNRVGEWLWRSNTSDNDPHNIFIKFDEPGLYTMEVSGRSKFHALDRFVLFIEGKTLTEAQNADRSTIVQP